MRRRRHVLQVSTFPFLAVLLCTMGSLILLLLVIDRRAKAVSRVKAAMIVAESMQAKAQQEKVKEDEWAEARRKLHASLEGELQDVRGQTEKITHQVGTVATDLAGEQTQSSELHERLDREKERYSLILKAVTARKDELAETGKQDEVTEHLRRQMTADLMNLEQTLADLIALRKREQRTFSLVPYKGRRGENRKPIYLECTATGWTFHPDWKTLFASEAGVKNLRAELEGRLSSTTASKESAPYLFLLVRPDGIGNYYRAVAAMQGLQFDFGYEFVDASWILDFSQKNETAQPWMTAGPALTPNAPSPIAATSPKESAGARHNGSKATAAITLGSDAPQGQSEASTGGTPGGSFHKGPAGGAPMRDDSASNGTPQFRADATHLKGGENDQPPGLPGSPAGMGGTQSAGTSAGGSSVANPVETDSSSPALRSEDSASRLNGGRGKGAGSNPAVSELGRARASFENEGAPASASGGSGTATIASGDAKNPTSPLTPPSRSFPGSAPGGTLTKTSSTGGTGAIGSAPGAPTEDEPAAGLGPPSLSRLPSGAGNKASVLPARPARLTGNRDWVIPLECSAESVTLPGGARVSARSLAEGDAGAKALLQAVQQLIERKQATVRAGEPPYRPQVRFMVHPDGLRVYHLAYPTLEPLSIPILRQNLAPEDPNQSGMGGRKP